MKQFIDKIYNRYFIPAIIIGWLFVLLYFILVDITVIKTTRQLEGLSSELKTIHRDLQQEQVKVDQANQQLLAIAAKVYSLSLFTGTPIQYNLQKAVRNFDTTSYNSFLFDSIMHLSFYFDTITQNYPQPPIAQVAEVTNIDIDSSPQMLAVSIGTLKAKVVADGLDVTFIPHRNTKASSAKDTLTLLLVNRHEYINASRFQRLSLNNYLKSLDGVYNITATEVNIPVTIPNTCHYRFFVDYLQDKSKHWEVTIYHNDKFLKNIHGRYPDPDELPKIPKR